MLRLVTQHWHIKRRQTRQIRREERLSDSCLPGWVTLLRDPLRGAQPWVMSVPQSGRRDFKHEARTPSTPLAAPSPAVLLSSMGDLWRPSQQSPRHESVPSTLLLPQCSPTVTLLLSHFLSKESSQECWQNVNKCPPHHCSSLALPYSPSSFCFLITTLLAANSTYHGQGQKPN